MSEERKNAYLAGVYAFNFAFFLLMILSLPTHESPKFIFWGLFVLSSLIIGLAHLKTHLKSWDSLDLLIVSWMLSGLIVAYFAGIKHKEWDGAADTIVFTCVLLILRKRRFDDKQLKLIYLTIMLSTLAASLVALWQFYNLGNMEFLEFHSVGHVNHTAIYLALSLVASLAMIHAFWKTMKTGERYLQVSIFTAIALTLVVTDSRAAVFAAILFVASGLLVFRTQIAPTILMLSILLGLVFGNYLVNRGGVIEKQIDQVERGIFFQARLKIWRGALLTWQEFPLYGTGIKNYDRVSIEQLMKWCSKQATNCDQDSYMPYPHGHNLYLNTLAERGIFGLLVIMANIAVLAYLVYRYRPGAGAYDNETYIMLWTGAYGSLFINMAIGFLNTTLHHEHAMLSIILLGLYLARMGGDSEPSHR